MKIFLLFFFVALQSFPQKCIVTYDSINNNVIPFSYIKVKDKIYTSNQDGVASFYASNSDTLLIKNSFYKDKWILNKDVKDTIFLTPTIEILENIEIVSYQGYKTKTYDQKNNFGFIIPAKASEIISCLNFNDKKMSEAYIKSISYEVSTKNRLTKYLDKITESDNYIIKLNIYSSNKDLNPIKNIEKSIIKTISIKSILDESKSNKKGRFLLTFDVEHYQINFLNQNICIGLEVVNTSIKNEKLKEIVMFHPFLTLKNNKNIESKTYFTGVFEKQKKLKTFFEYYPNQIDFMKNREPKLIPSFEIYYKK